MGGQIRRGRILGRPDFPSRGPQIPIFKGFGDLWTEHRGAPKTPNSTTTDLTLNHDGSDPPICGPLTFLKVGGTQKEFGQTACANCFQLGLLGWVVSGGGGFSPLNTLMKCGPRVAGPECLLQGSETSRSAQSG